MTKEARSRWCSAIVLSVCAHMAIVAAISLIPQRVTEKEPAMSVRLVALPGRRGTDGGGAGNGGGLKQQKTAQSATQPKKSQAKPQRQETKPVKAARMDKPKETPKPVNEPVKAEASKETTTAGNGLEEAAASLYAVKGASGKGEGEGVGGGYGYGIADVGGLEVLKKVTPEYPLFSRKRREEGTAVVIARVENGSVTSAGLERSSGHARLDDSALRAVKGWKFNSTGVIRVRIPFAFRIKG